MKTMIRDATKVEEALRLIKEEPSIHHVSLRNHYDEDPILHLADVMTGDRAPRRVGVTIIVGMENPRSEIGNRLAELGVTVGFTGAPKRAAAPATEDELSFTIPVEPQAKQRLRHRIVTPKSGAKPFASGYTPDQTTEYEKVVGLHAQVAAKRARWAWTDKDRFTVLVKFHRKHEGAGGDLDNYVKSLFDGMNNIVWSDDARVRQLGAVIVGPSSRPRVEVTIRRHRRGERAARKAKPSTKS